MTEKTNSREPKMGEYDGHKQWNCRWPGCEFDTLDEAQWIEHIDPRTGAHREPLGEPGVNDLDRLQPTERAEFEDLQAEVEELRKFKAAAEKAAEKDAPRLSGKTGSE